MIRLRRSGIEVHPDWSVTVDAAFADAKAFWKAARAFEKLAEHGAKRKKGFGAYAGHVLPVDEKGKPCFPAVWSDHEATREAIAGMSYGACAYCQSPVSSNHPGKGGERKPPGQIEHFLPKSRFPAQGVLAANLRNRPGLRCDPRAHAGGRGWGTTRIGGRTSTRRARRSRAGVGCTAAVAGRSRRHSGRTPLTWRARTAWPRRHGRCASTRGSWRSSRRARRGAWSSLGVSWSSAALGSVSRARSRSSSWVGRGIACASRLSVARAARWSSSRWRARSGAAAHDGGDGADARAGVHRGGGLPQGHRRTGKGMSGGAVVGPVLGDALRVPKPPRHRHQAPGCPFGNSA